MKDTRFEIREGEGISKEINSKQNILLCLILLLAFLLRFYHLTFQSLWLDELYAMCISDPTHSIQTILTDIKADFHPPFYYFVAHYFFKVLGYSDFSGRLLSVIIGTLGVFAMYFFGKEIKDKRTGLLMALLTAVSYYQIFHSQEVRMYILLFLFTVLSATFFLRIIRLHKKSDYILFVLVTVLLLYTHYFGFFVFAAELLYALYLIVNFDLPIARKGLFAVMAVFILYSPWLPYILSAGNRSHWMVMPPIWYFFNYLYDYTGKDPLSTLLFLVGLVLFIKYLFSSFKVNGTIEDSKYLFILLAMFSIYMFTYAVSLVKPIILLRCTIAGLPFLIAAVVLGLDSLKRKWAYVFFVTLVVSALVNLFYIRSYYTTRTKEDFRDVAIEMNNKYPDYLYLSHYAMHFNYYFEQHNLRLTVVDPLDKNPDSLLKNVPEFIMLNAHSKENIMSLENYSSLSRYVSQNYSVDTIYRIPHSKTENAVMFTLKK